MIRLVGMNAPGSGGPKCPGRDSAIRTGESSGCQRLLDQQMDLRLPVRVGGEQYPKPHRVIGHGHGHGHGMGVVGCERARWWVIPSSAQRDGDRAARRVGVAAGVDHQDSVMGVGRMCRGYAPGGGISVEGAVTVTVLVLVLVLTLVLVLVLGGTVVVVVGSVVVVGGVVVGAVVSVTVRVGGAITRPDVDVVVVVVVVVVGGQPWTWC